MNRTDLQLYGGILLGILLLVLIALTIVYLRRRTALRREALRRAAKTSEDKAADEHSGSKGYWINRDDIEEGSEKPSLRYYHYFDNIDECIHDLITEMYDCGFVRTEEIFVTAYGESALTHDSVIYMTDRDGDVDKAYASLPPVSEDRQKQIYDKWCGYVAQLLDTVELHTTEANQSIIKDALMVYGRKKISTLLRSPE